MVSWENVKGGIAGQRSCSRVGKFAELMLASDQKMDLIKEFGD